MSKRKDDGWEYTFSEVLVGGATGYGHPVETLEGARAAQQMAQMNYPWPEEIRVARRRKAGPWEDVPEGEQ